jgi:hypothetical protein
MNRFTTSISTSWQLLKHCWHFLTKNKDLLWLPIVSLISQISIIVVTCTAFISYYFTKLLPLIKANQDTIHHIGQNPYILYFIGIIGLILISLVFSFITIYFNTVMISCIANRLQGKYFSLSEGFRFANTRLKKIFQWSLITVLVSSIIHQLERVRFIGPLVGTVLGIAWALATYFVLPIMVLENKGPKEAIGLAKSKLGSSWRRVVSVNLIIGLLLGVIILLLLGLNHLLPFLQTDITVVITVLIIGFLIFITTFGTTMQCIVKTSLYLSLFEDKPTDTFDKTLLESAIIKRR